MAKEIDMPRIFMCNGGIMSNIMTPNILKLTLLGAILAAAIPATRGDVLVTMGDTVASAWDSAPTIGTATPAFDTMFAIGGTQLEQTITVGASPVTIDKIEFAYGAPKMTADLSLYIWEMGESEDPTLPGFVDNRAATLLSTNSYAFDSSAAVIPDGSILSFDLTGSDEITLSANVSYVVCMMFSNRTNNARVGSTTAASNATSAYLGGTLFYNEAYISGGGVGSDSAFAIYAVPEPATYALGMAFAAGLLVTMRRRLRRGR